jgi:hypothetical protein
MFLVYMRRIHVCIECSACENQYSLRLCARSWFFFLCPLSVCVVSMHVCICIPYINQIYIHIVDVPVSYLARCYTCVYMHTCRMYIHTHMVDIPVSYPIRCCSSYSSFTATIPLFTCTIQIVHVLSLDDNTQSRIKK